MTAPAPTALPGRVMISFKPHRSYRHEAFLYRGVEEFLAETVPFVRDGISAGQPVIVAIRAEREAELREALGPDEKDLLSVDMAEFGRNPARIIPGIQRFLARHGGPGRPARGIGEPVWAGRRAAEVAEAQLHEALLNVAVDPDTPLWLRCPYDVAALSEPQLAEAARSHPILVESGGYLGSRTYGGMQHVTDLFAQDLPEPDHPTDGVALPAPAEAVTALLGRHSAGLDAERAWALSRAVAELAAAAPAGATLRVWSEPGALVCELRDRDPVDDPMTGRRDPGGGPDPRGLWLANQLCDLVQVRSTPRGTAVRLVSWL